MRKIAIIFVAAMLLILTIRDTHGEQKNMSVPYLSSVIYDSANNQIIVFGGYSKYGGTSSSDTWVFDIGDKKWEKIKVEEAPLAREQHSAIYDSTNKQMIIFGGVGQNGYLSDTWVFDIEQKTGDRPVGKWEKIKAKKTPPARKGHSAIYDSANKQMFIFGGSSGSNIRDLLSDVWIFDIEKKQWKKIKTEEAPPAREWHSAVYDEANKQMIIYGGSGMRGLLSDVWLFDIEKKEWEEIETEEAPPARSGHSAIYDSVNKQMFIFGGRGQTEVLSDTWVFDINKKSGNPPVGTWKEIPSSGKIPVAREFHNAIYDSFHKQMIILGGQKQSEANQAAMSGGVGKEDRYLSDIWAFDIENRQWKEIPSSK